MLEQFLHFLTACKSEVLEQFLHFMTKYLLEKYRSEGAGTVHALFDYRAESAGTVPTLYDCL